LPSVGVSAVRGAVLRWAGVPVMPRGQRGSALCMWPVIAVLVLRALRADPRHWYTEVNGSWFLISVAANSIGVLSGSLAKMRPQFTDVFAVLSMCAWVVGLIFYLTILFGVATRVARRQLTAE